MESRRWQNLFEEIHLQSSDHHSMPYLRLSCVCACFHIGTGSVFVLYTQTSIEMHITMEHMFLPFHTHPSASCTATTQAEKNHPPGRKQLKWNPKRQQKAERGEGGGGENVRFAPSLIIFSHLEFHLWKSVVFILVVTPPLPTLTIALALLRFSEGLFSSEFSFVHWTYSF